MNKKLFYLASVASLGLLVSSCTNELEAPATNGDGLVTFTAKLPSTINSRAYSNGEGADQLSYAVYKTGTTDIVYSSKQEDAPKAIYNEDLSFSLQLPLVKGQTYDLVFWADKKDNEVYTFNPATQTISIAYDEVLSNDETRDAFFTAEKEMLVTGAMHKDIKLFRPFAQLNIGTNDIAIAERAGTVLGQTSVEVKSVYSTLNLFSGEADDEVDVTFGFADLPEGELFPTNPTEYTYLSMNYILTGDQIIGNDVNAAQKETKDIKIAIKDEDGKAVNSFDVSAVPFQRNYRTNIYGALLTSTVDFTIDVKPGYNDPDYDLEQLFVAAASGGKVTLSEDMTLPEGSFDVKANTVIDLGGHTLTIPTAEGASWGINANGPEAVLTIEGNGTVVGGTNAIPVGARNGGKVVINGGTFQATEQSGSDGAVECVYVNDGTVEINGGYFSTGVARAKSLIKNPNCPDYGWYYVLNKANQSEGEIIVTGGQFENYSPAWGDDADETAQSFVAPGYGVIAEEVASRSADTKIVYTVVKGAVAADEASLKDAIAEGGLVIVPANAQIELTEQFSFDKPTDLLIDGEIVSYGKFRLQVNADLNVTGKGTITTGGDTDGQGGWGIFDINNGANVSIKDIDINHTNKYDGTPISLNDGNLYMENVRMVTQLGNVRSRETAKGTFVAKNCYFETHSNASRPTNGIWSYALLMSGDVDVTLDNCEVLGVHGGVSASKGSRMTINGGKYTTDKLDDEPSTIHYAVYVAQGSTITINDGYFASYENRPAVYNGNNDSSSNPTFGGLIIKGGYFKNQGYNQETQENFITPAEGYKWVENDDEVYKFKVVKE